MNIKCVIDCIGKIFNDFEFQKDLLISVITSFISVLMVIITNYITLHVNNKNLRYSKLQFEKTMNEQKRQFEQQMELQTKQFTETIRRENERERIEIMPYFELNENTTIIYQEGKIQFPLIFMNIGNGTAIRTSVEIHNLVAYEDTFLGIKYLQYEPMSATVVKMEKSTETMIITEYKEGPNEVIITLRFEDMMNREYKQKFSFYYEADRDNKIFVQKHYKPECLKDCL